MIQVWPTVERFLTEHGAAVPVTLAKVQGSSPREPRARFMVRPDGRLSATFDGVALECLALAEAQSMTAGPGAPYRRFDKALERLGDAASASIAIVPRRVSAAGASHA
jgi:xanthine/CO dehydrogenase XdhC/CoxF family maturation factor